MQTAEDHHHRQHQHQHQNPPLPPKPPNLHRSATRTESSSPSPSSSSGIGYTDDLRRQEVGRTNSASAVASPTAAAGAAVDPLTQWMKERQSAFRQFELDTARAFRPIDDFRLRNSINFFEDDDYEDEFLRFRRTPRMLSSRTNDSLGQDLSPKAKVSYDEQKFQVELNVQGYAPEELALKTEGDILIVLAKHETKTEDGGSFVSKQFEQRFSLPSGVEPESITSSLSKEGILTITAPRDSVKRITNQQLTRNLNDSSNSPVFSSTSSDKDVVGLPQPKVKYDDGEFQISLDCREYKPEELDVKVEGNTIIVTAKQEVKEIGGVRTRVFEQKFSLPSGVKAESVVSSLTKDGMLNITAPRGNTTATVNRTTIEEHMDRILSPGTWNTTTSSINKTDDDNSSSLIKSDLHHEPRARIITEDDTYKILINVTNYKPEELVIKTLGNTIHIEAKHEEKTPDGHSYSSRNFSQSFTLPRGVNPESVVSSLSKDGTLTISAPLPTLKSVSGERLVPIKHN